MKKIINIIAIIALLVGAVIFQSVRLDRQQDKYDTAIQNNKAYVSQIDELNNEKKAFLLTIDQLCYMNDKSINELDSMRRELKIKDSKIKQMSRYKERIFIQDTVTVHDTIFAHEGFELDTTLGDKWYTNRIHLAYPNEISSEINVNTDQSVFLYTTRETIDPPRKTWLGRLFQRKHDVYNVTVKELNPYATTKENKFIIIKD